MQISWRVRSRKFDNRPKPKSNPTFEPVLVLTVNLILSTYGLRLSLSACSVWSRIVHLRVDGVKRGGEWRLFKYGGCDGIQLPMLSANRIRKRRRRRRGKRGEKEGRRGEEEGKRKRQHRFL